MSWLIENEVIIVAADNNIKVFKFANTQVVGGGSLNKRLGGSVITCMEVDPASCRVFLGTNKNIVLVYHINPSTFQPAFLFAITLTGPADSVSCLCFSHGYFLCFTIFIEIFLLGMEVMYSFII